MTGSKESTARAMPSPLCLNVSLSLQCLDVSTLREHIACEDSRTRGIHYSFLLPWGLVHKVVANLLGWHSTYLLEVSVHKTFLQCIWQILRFAGVKFLKRFQLVDNLLAQQSQTQTKLGCIKLMSCHEMANLYFSNGKYDCFTGMKFAAPIVVQQTEGLGQQRLRVLSSTVHDVRVDTYFMKLSSGSIYSVTVDTRRT